MSPKQTYYFLLFETTPKFGFGAAFEFESILDENENICDVFLVRYENFDTFE